MTPLLDVEPSPVLESLAHRSVLVAFDFDGTLAPLVDDPAAARLREETRRLLRLTALLYPCAVVSGRKRSDVAARLAGIPLVAIAGTHGREPGFGPPDRAARALVARWRAALEAALVDEPDLRIEDKGLLLSIHHRGARAAHAARRLALEAATRLEGARVALGRAVVHVLPPDTRDKGEALEEILHRERLETALYVGDDHTDEDAFRCPSVAVSVRIGRSSRSAAGYYLPDQDGLDALLRALIRARTPAGAGSDRIEALAQAIG